MRAAWTLAILGVACGGPMAASKAPMAAPAPRLLAQAAAPAAESAPKPAQEKLVITGWLRVAVDDGPAMVKELRAFVGGLGGRVVHEDLVGRERSWYGELRLRVPPEQVTPLLDWLEKQGDVEQRRIEATDVSKEYFDQELALKNLRLTLDRLQALLGREAMQMKDVLEVEREMARVRGEIERIEGEHRFLEDRIAYATIDLRVGMRGDVVFAPHAKFHPGPRGSVLFLLDADPMREEQRFGAGVTLHIDRAFTMDLDVFPGEGMDRRALMATVGGAAYSDFLGAGRRRFLNPYLGLRLGYAWLHERSTFVFAGEAGVELLKHEWLLVDLSARAIGLAHEDGADAAVQVAAGIQIPF